LALKTHSPPKIAMDRIFKVFENQKKTKSGPP